MTRHDHQRKIRLACYQREKFGGGYLCQLGIGARNYRCAPRHSLIDHRHLADDPAGPDGLVDRTAAHHPQHAALDDVKCIRVVAFAE